MSTPEPRTPDSGSPEPEARPQARTQAPAERDAGASRARHRIGWTAAAVLVLAAAGGTAYALTDSGSGTPHRVVDVAPPPAASARPGSPAPASLTPGSPAPSASPSPRPSAPGVGNVPMSTPPPPASPSSSPTTGGTMLPVTSYASSQDGRTLWLSDSGLITSGCTHYSAIARQTATTVTVGLLRTSTARRGAACPMFATVTKPLPVNLSAPLGDRRVVSLVTAKAPQRTAVVSPSGVVTPKH